MTIKLIIGALIASLVGCGPDSPSPHDVVACDPAWVGQTGGCERACQMVPANFAGSASDMQCNATHPDVATQTCFRTFTFDGIVGCCIPDVTTRPVRFFECQ